MKLTSLANQRVIQSRLQAVSGGGNKLEMSTVTACLVHLQPVAAEKVLLVQGVPGKTYRIFAEGDIDIQEGDQLKDEDQNIYTVKKGGVTKWQHGAMDYQEVIIIRS